MFEAWSALLNELSQFVIPDWGALIALIPIGILMLVIVVFGPGRLSVDAWLKDSGGKAR